MNPLTPASRRELRAKAHHLQPFVTIGQHGLTPAVLHEIDLALLKHELIKVRVFSDARDQREAMLEQVCADMECAAVQHLGKVLVLWRPNPELKKPAPRPAKAASKPAPGAKRPKAARTGPRTAARPGARAPSRHDSGQPCMRARELAAPRVLRHRRTNSRLRQRPSRREPAPAAWQRGAAGTSRQKIRARGAAAPAFGDASGPRFEAPAERRKSILHAEDQAEVVQCQAQSPRGLGQEAAGGRRQTGHAAAPPQGLETAARRLHAFHADGDPAHRSTRPRSR